MTIKAPLTAHSFFKLRFLIDCAATFSALCTAQAKGALSVECVCVSVYVQVCECVCVNVCECVLSALFTKQC